MLFEEDWKFTTRLHIFQTSEPGKIEFKATRKDAVEAWEQELSEEKKYHYRKEAEDRRKLFPKAYKKEKKLEKIYTKKGMI